MVNHLPYVGRLRQQVMKEGMYPAGHFYSPIPTGDDVRRALHHQKRGFPDIALHADQQFRTLQAFEKFYPELPFKRFHFNQTAFCHADAIFLYCFLRHARPARIIEVGSGYSSAVMLDTVEKFFPVRPRMTFIEPYPKNLRRVLTAEDASQVTVIEKGVQDVPCDLFDQLESGDLLFIDSSHVVKCGSDVQYLMFEILPYLRPGVFVHFHDIFHSFEYPPEWLTNGWYWNEAYFLRAFLAYNSEWEIYFFNSYVGEAFKAFLAEHMALCVGSTGGSLYLRRREDSRERLTSPTC